MEYCKIHKDLSEEEGNGCPLCESMIEKGGIVDRWAEDRRKLQTELVEKDKRLAELVGLLQGAPHGLAAKTEGLDTDQEIINEKIKG